MTNVTFTHNPPAVAGHVVLPTGGAGHVITMSALGWRGRDSEAQEVPAPLWKENPIPSTANGGPLGPGTHQPGNFKLRSKGIREDVGSALAELTTSERKPTFL